VTARVLVFGGFAGAILGALIAWFGATQVFVCGPGPGTGTVSCASPHVGLALVWGVPIGLVVGVAAAVLRSRRRSSVSHEPD